MFKIGNVEIKNNVVMAPMAGISNSAFRTIIKEFGAGLIVAEMVSDKAITYGNKKTIDMLYMTTLSKKKIRLIKHWCFLILMTLKMLTMCMDT